MTQPYCLASMAAWLSSTGISYPSPPSHPLDPSFSSQQQPLHWDCSTIPKLQLPATEPSREPGFLFGVCMAVARTVWFSFHLGCHRSAVSLSDLNVSPLIQAIAPLWGSDPCFSSPNSNTPVFPPLSLILLSFAWFYIFFSTGQVLLSTLSWCFASTSDTEVLYSWCIYGERCTLHPPTPLPSCSFFFFWCVMLFLLLY